MTKTKSLLDAYECFVNLPWQDNLSGSERIWFCIYEPKDERRIRMRLSEFGNVTKKAGHNWQQLDLTYSFEDWMVNNEYREAYFENPKLLSTAIDLFTEEWVIKVKKSLQASDPNTVLALVGIGSLFGITHTSSLIEEVNDHISGRLLVFFPGTRADSNYRLLDARDGWNYLAIPIEAEENLL
jgi:hypothetical protein